MSEDRTISLACPIPAVDNEVIEMAHGGGGLVMHRLITDIFRPAFASSAGDMSHDGAVLDLGGARLAFTTDSYVVRPLFFPGGDIGALAVNGTVNDIAMCGAEPLYLSVGFVLEEGLPIEALRRVVASMREAARRAQVRLVTGDTKVVERGRGDGLYLNTAGIGAMRVARAPSPQEVRAGDAVLLSGDIGRHGIAVMSAREGFGFEGEIASDTAPLAATVMALIDAGIPLHCLRDPTRGDSLRRSWKSRKRPASISCSIPPPSPSPTRCAAPARFSDSTHSTSRTKDASSPSFRRTRPQRRSPSSGRHRTAERPQSSAAWKQAKAAACSSRE